MDLGVVRWRLGMQWIHWDSRIRTDRNQGQQTIAKEIRYSQEAQASCVVLVVSSLKGDLSTAALGQRFEKERLKIVI